MHSIWSFLQQTAAASTTALLLLLLRRGFRGKLSPRCFCILWFVLPVRMLIPVGFLGFVTALDLSWPVDLLRTAVELRMSSAYSDPYRTDLPLLPVPLLPTAAPRSAADWLFLVYLGGALGFAAWFLFSHLRLRRVLRRAVPISPERMGRIRKLAAAYRLPVPRKIVSAPGLQRPFLVGVLRGALVLPDTGVDYPVILHELYHLRREDLLSGWLDTCLRCIHWPNPLLWYALDRMANDREARCDQRVLELLKGEERRSYGHLLAAMADDARLRTPGATTMANSARHIGERIEAVVHFRRCPEGMSLAACFMALALTVSVALGRPAVAAEVTGAAAGSLPLLLTQARQSRPTTPLGALDTFAKALYAETYNPGAALLYRAMALPESHRHTLPESVWQEWSPEEENHRGAYATGPFYYGAVPDGEGWLCQVTFFRDAESVDGQGVSDTPIEYRVHTVSLRPDGRYWSARSLGSREGQLPADTVLYWDAPLPAAAVWRAEYEGVSVAVEPLHTVRLGTAGFVDGRSREIWSYIAPPDRGPSRTPVLDETYMDINLAWRVTVTNLTGQPVDIAHTLKAIPSGADRASCTFWDGIAQGESFTLAPGESISRSAGGGSGGGELDRLAGWTAYEAALSVNGHTHALTMEREVNIP